jgi:diguanylate cyclase (GGDEF)-like protein
MQLDQHSQIIAEADAGAHEVTMQTVARFAVASVREMDVVGHFKPGCLALVLPGTEFTNAVRVAERVRQMVSKSALSFGRNQWHVTVSIGVVESTDRDDAVSLLKRAESALEMASCLGGNRTALHDGASCAPVEPLILAHGEAGAVVSPPGESDASTCGESDVLASG